jgi:hypothetical protein
LKSGFQIVSAGVSTRFSLRLIRKKFGEYRVQRFAQSGRRSESRDSRS